MSKRHRDGNKDCDARATSSVPDELQALLEKCQQYGRCVSRQVRDDIALANTLHKAPHEEFFLTNASCTLHPHQVDGIRWLYALFKNGVNGILADEMGLGKTVQVCGFFSLLYGQKIFGTHLVVVPLSTVANWKREFEKWCPWLPVVVYHGDKDQRSVLRNWLKQRFRHCVKHKQELQARIDKGEAIESLVKTIGCVTIATYEMVLSDQGALGRVGFSWDVIVVDEAHRLKNFNCRLIERLKQFPCEGKVLLTGTPLQNNIRELWSILNFIVPELFDTVDSFREWFEHAELTQLEQSSVPDALASTAPRERSAPKIEPGSNINLASIRANSNRTTVPTLSSHFRLSLDSDVTPPSVVAVTDVHSTVAGMHTALRPFILRRTKGDIPSLAIPPKYDVLVYCPLTRIQQQRYNEVKTLEKYTLNRLMHLRKVCCHPFLFAEFTPTSFHQTITAEVADTLSLEECQQHLGVLLKCSSKLTMLHKLLSRLLVVAPSSSTASTDGASRHKILLFSQMTRVLDVVEEYIALVNSIRRREQHEAPSSSPRVITFVRIDGSCSMDERNESVSKFMQPAAAAGHTTTTATAAVASDDSVFDLDESLEQSIAVDAHHCCDDNSDASVDLFLISTKSGGLGLNLVAADTVILFDGDFNPHNDRQAIDRCHRIGQTRPVVVYRFVAPLTVEEAMLKIASRKMKMETVVIGKANLCVKDIAEGDSKWKTEGRDDEDVESSLQDLTMGMNFSSTALDALELSEADIDVLASREKIVARAEAQLSCSGSDARKL